MKQIIGVLFTLIVLAVTHSCKKEECGDCFTPPRPFLFEIVDKTSGENLFSNGTLDPASIKVKDTDNNFNIPFTFLDEDSINIIVINSIGWQTEQVNLRLEISDQPVFSMYVNAERLFENCCSFTMYREILIKDSEFEWEPEKEMYKILYKNQKRT
ncbi:MAG: hypothetical protein H0S84_02585 [Bacteroidales bacterium]|jgi:hypothetical protein|nr:hypothetical protein [Bacteroidales bacterium]MDN5350910.1 hypothetical protein [Bacteroidales bacterium]